MIALSSGGVWVFLLIALALVVFEIAAGWIVFSKAGQPGWAWIIPFYSTWVLLKVVGRPGWWIILLLFIPIVNLVCWIIVMLDLAKSFGTGSGFGLGLVFLPWIFIPILAFGSARYVGPATV